MVSFVLYSSPHVGTMQTCVSVTTSKKNRATRSIYTRGTSPLCQKSRRPWKSLRRWKAIRRSRRMSARRSIWTMISWWARKKAREKGHNCSRAGWVGREVGDTEKTVLRIHTEFSCYPGFSPCRINRCLLVSNVSSRAGDILVGGGD